MVMLIGPNGVQGNLGPTDGPEQIKQFIAANGGAVQQQIAQAPGAPATQAAAQPALSAPATPQPMVPVASQPINNYARPAGLMMQGYQGNAPGVGPGAAPTPAGGSFWNGPVNYLQNLLNSPI